MINLKDFDYILFKDEQGRCFVKIKNTGEITEINEQLMKFLRSEEKRLYRELEAKSHINSDDSEKKAKASVLCPVFYFNAIDEDEYENESFVLADQHNFEDDLIAEDLEQRFISLLTESQKEIFYCIMLGGEKQSDYAKRKGIKPQSVSTSIEYIRKKAKKFFNDT